MSSPITITLLGEPKGKGRGRATVSKKTGRAFVYTPAATVSYEASLKHAASKEMGARPPFDKAVSVEVTAQFLPPRSWSQKKQQAALRGEVFPTVRPDLDNAVKAIFDAFNKVVWRDDALVVRATVQKRYGTQAFVVVTAREIASP